MQTTPENIRRASEMIEAWRAVNRGFEKTKRWRSPRTGRLKPLENRLAEDS